MALLAKNMGMVKIWPIPMKRSRVLTRQAMISENVENKAEANIATTTTNVRFMGLQFMPTPISTARTIDDCNLRKRPDTCRQCFAKNQRLPRCRADQKLVNNAEVPFPNDRYAVEDSYEQHALSQNSRSHERKVGQRASVDYMYSCEDFAEDQQPQEQVAQLGSAVQLGHGAVC